LIAFAHSFPGRRAFRPVGQTSYHAATQRTRNRPDQKIVVLCRSDASGSTAIFTDAGGEVIHLPLVLGGVVPAYKLDQVKEPLRLTGWELHWKGRRLEG
jgi:ABC-type phosphate transport system substrate-binding protein